MLSEISLVEVVVRSIRAVGQMPDENFEGRELLLEDLYELLNRVAIKALSSQHSMQVCKAFKTVIIQQFLGRGLRGGKCRWKENKKFRRSLY